jgi:hypothetical protein
LDEGNWQACLAQVQELQEGREVAVEELQDREKMEKRWGNDEEKLGK